ncbi:MAG: hypothetical protein ACK526_14565 [Planctomyces sp.]
MKHHALIRALIAVTVFASADHCMAQLPQTRLTSIFPAGAQHGQTIDVTLTAGTDLDEVDQLVFSHPEIIAVPKKDAAGNPVANVFVVTVAPTVPPGLYDVRTRGLFGISNPRAFRVDTLPEAAEAEPNNAAEQVTAVALNSVVNAKADSATDVDFFRVHLEAGQTAVFRTEAARIDSPLQPVIQLYNAAGRRVAESRRIFLQEASLVYTADQAGDMLLKVTDIVYSGGADHVYRLTVDTRPLVDLVVPSIVSADQPSTVTVMGRYLPGGEPTGETVEGMPLLAKQMTIDLKQSGGTSVGFPAFSSPLTSLWWNGVEGNLLPVSVSSLPPVLEQPEKDQTAKTPQTITVPGEVSGRFSAKGDEDEYRFAAKKGESWVIEIYGHRQGSITDPLLMVERVITAADGTETFSRLGTEDDQKQDPGGKDLPTLSADPSFQLAVPEDGVYRIRVRDQYADSRGDPRLTYRLSVRKPEPDYRLLVFDAFPSADGVLPATSGAISLRKGGNYQLSVYAYRQDGHDGAIRLQASQLPEGITCSGATIGPGQPSAILVLSAAENCSELAVPIQIEGRSGPADAEVVRTARVATLVHDVLNGLPRTARMSDSLVAGVMKDEQPFHVVVEPGIREVSQDQQLLVPVKIVRRGGFDGKVDLTFFGVPANVDAPPFAIDKGADSGIGRLFLKENAPATTSTVVISGLAPVSWRRNPWMAERAAAKLKDSEGVLAASEKTSVDAVAAFEAAGKMVTANNEQIAAIVKEVETLAAAQKTLKEQFAESVAGYKASLDELAKVKEQLASVSTSKDSTPEAFDAAIKAVTEATTLAETASVAIQTLTTKIETVSKSLVDAKTQEAAKTTEKAALEAKLPDLKKAVETTQKAMVDAANLVKQATAEKAAADAAHKKAEEATKPANVNVRTVSVPLIVNIGVAPAKVTAAALEGGVVKKGSTVPVKVTVARKNGFAGPLKITVVVPEQVKGVTSNVADLAADQTEVTLMLTAAADAAVGDVPMAVVRATGDFNGRPSSVDLPLAIKVTE